MNKWPVLFHPILWGVWHCVLALSATVRTLALGADCRVACKVPDASDSCRCTAPNCFSSQSYMLRWSGIICSHSLEHMNYKTGCGLRCCKMGKEKTLPLLEDDVFLFSSYWFEQITFPFSKVKKLLLGSSHEFLSRWKIPIYLQIPWPPVRWILYNTSSFPLKMHDISY